MYEFTNKLVCLFESLKVADNNKKSLPYYEICPFSVHYKLVMFYSKFQRGYVIKPFTDLV